MCINSTSVWKLVCISVLTACFVVGGVLLWMQCGVNVCEECAQTQAAHAMTDMLALRSRAYVEARLLGAAAGSLATLQEYSLHCQAGRYGGKAMPPAVCVMAGCNVLVIADPTPFTPLSASVRHETSANAWLLLQQAAAQRNWARRPHVASLLWHLPPMAGQHRHIQPSA